MTLLFSFWFSSLQVIQSVTNGEEAIIKTVGNNKPLKSSPRNHRDEFCSEGEFVTAYSSF